MPANYSKKLGLPQFSSHQFAVTLRTELTDLSQLEKTAADLYGRLQEAVDSQIVNPGFVPGDPDIPLAVAPANGSAVGPRDEPWRCSEKQRDLILKIVDEQRLDKAEVEQLAQQRFGAGVRQLNKLQASSLIDELLETHNGAGHRNGGRRSLGRGAR